MAVKRGQKGLQSRTMKLRLVITELSINPIHLPRARQRLKYLNPMQQKLRNPEQMHRWWKHLKPVWKSPG